MYTILWADIKRSFESSQETTITDVLTISQNEDLLYSKFLWMINLTQPDSELKILFWDSVNFIEKFLLNANTENQTLNTL